jgi:membrane dipeptidase
MEGAQPLRGDLRRLDHFAARGVRYLGLLHLSDNECGRTSTGRGARSPHGLRPFGRDTIARCEELGIVVDLAHLNKAGFMEALALATKPVYVSHTGLSGVHDMWRNIDDEQLRGVAEGGGVAGVIFCPRYLGGDGIGKVVEHIVHVIDVAGEDAVALGSDWDGFIRPSRGLEEVSKLPALTDALLARGLRPAVVRKILRANALRVLREAAP